MSDLTTEEIFYAETDQPSMMTNIPEKFREEFRRFFGEAASIHIHFTAYWERIPREPEAGFLTDSFDVTKVELHGASTTYWLYGNIREEDIEISKIPINLREVIEEAMREYAIDGADYDSLSNSEFENRTGHRVEDSDYD
jgi:hypothetical protein